MKKDNRIIHQHIIVNLLVVSKKSGIPKTMFVLVLMGTILLMGFVGCALVDLNSMILRKKLARRCVEKIRSFCWEAVCVSLGISKLMGDVESALLIKFSRIPQKLAFLDANKISNIPMANAFV